jgi:hypothetical protein
MPSRPHAYQTWGGAYLLDPEDCSVFDQCFSINAQLLTYQWWLQVYYAQPCSFPALKLPPATRANKMHS